MREEHSKLYKIVLTGLMAALCYVCFAFLKIPIPTIGGDFVALHVGTSAFSRPCFWGESTAGWPDPWG